MKIVIAPDSFKHCLSSKEVCLALKTGLIEADPSAEVICLPIADGGEGTAEAVLSAYGGQKMPITVSGPEGYSVETYFVKSGNTAVIEAASICGLMMMNRPNPETASTVGVGEAIISALDSGCSKIILCLGGSATTDCGVGIMSALGAVFRSEKGVIKNPCGRDMSKIISVDTDRLDKRLVDCEILIACDVINPLYGLNGAAYVFSSQKGADENAVKRLDMGLRNMAGVYLTASGMPLDTIAGLGAAGGAAAGLYALCGANLLSGIDVVLNAVGFDKIIDGADLVITGEGRTDTQTLCGKVPLGVARRCRQKGVPVIVISGAVNEDVQNTLYTEGVSAVFPSILLTMGFSEAKKHSREWLRATARNVLRTAGIFRV